MAELLDYLARRLVDEPDAVRVEEIEEEDALVLRLRVAPDDVGKVIGRQGRIARGSGTTVQQVNQLLEARKQMEKMMKGMSKGKMPALPGMESAANGPGLTARPGSSSRKKKRKKSRSRR